MRLIKKILAHACIILGAMFATFSILNIYNDAMNFLNNDISHTLLLIWSFLSMITGGLFVAHMFKQENKSSVKEAPARSEKRNKSATKDEFDLDRELDSLINVEMRHDRNQPDLSQYHLFDDNSAEQRTPAAHRHPEKTMSAKTKPAGAARYKRNQL